MEIRISRPVTVIGTAFLVLGLLIGLAVGFYYGGMFVSNRHTSIYVSPGFAIVKFPISPLLQAVFTRGLMLDDIEVRVASDWRTVYKIQMSTDDHELSGQREYVACEWRLILREFKSISTCTTRREPLPLELLEAIRKGRELVANVHVPA